MEPEMQSEEEREKYFTSPAPEPRYHFSGSFGITLSFEEYDAAVEYYEQVLGPPAYLEGEGARGWQIGEGWFTLLLGTSGAPENVEVIFQVETPEEAEKLQRAFIEAGGEEADPVDQFMYESVRSYPVRDPFGTELVVISLLDPIEE